MAVLGPAAAFMGAAVSLFAAPDLGAGVAVLAPLAALAGVGITHLATHAETLLRLLTPAGRSRPASFALELATDLGSGAALGTGAGLLLGASLAPAAGVGALLTLCAGALRRAFVGSWIDEAVNLMGGNHLAAQGRDFAEQRALLEAGRVSEALDLFELESEERGGSPAPLVEAARVLLERGDAPGAVAFYRRAMAAPKATADRASVFARRILDITRRPPGLPGREDVAALEALVERFPDAPETAWAWKELTSGRSLPGGGPEPEEHADHLGAHGAHVPAVRAVERILADALSAGASDIHLEDYPDGLRVRYRVDGILHDVEPPPRRIRAAVLARIRVMAGLNPSEHPRPQDARIQVPFQGREVDVRVSTVPTVHGESIALRILDRTAGLMALEELGLEPADLERLLRAVSRPTGMVLATGPGGSGKSTTLHAIVRHLSTGREKIFTVEDPVEYVLDGVCQVSVNEKAGLGFANLLRSLVRQDPDVLLVGEIRDTETAEIATHAALTGHLVLSTLHTIDAVSALHRLVDIGVPPYMVVHTLEAVVAQRLVRRVCRACAREEAADPELVHALGPAAEGLERTWMAVGCDACRGTGYRGRIGIYELMTMDDELRQAFLHHAPRAELERRARAAGMSTLREDAVAKVRAGITTADEALRATRSAGAGA